MQNVHECIRGTYIMVFHMTSNKTRAWVNKLCNLSVQGTKRHDCLTQRMTASALGGHAGAQIAICGENAIGARIAVWWEGDEEYFEGVICWYDPVSTEYVFVCQNSSLIDRMPQCHPVVIFI